jgi:hypothetical protein
VKQDLIVKRNPERGGTGSSATQEGSGEWDFFPVAGVMGRAHWLGYYDLSLAFAFSPTRVLHWK